MYLPCFNMEIAKKGLKKDQNEPRSVLAVIAQRSPYIHMQHTSLTLGKHSSSNEYYSINFEDKDGSVLGCVCKLQEVCNKVF